MKLFVELGAINRSNWGAPEDVTLLVKRADTSEQVATVRYEFVGDDDGSAVGSQVGTIRCEADAINCPGEPIMIAAYAMKAVYDVFTGDHEFLADIFEGFPVIEFEV